MVDIYSTQWDLNWAGKIKTRMEFGWGFSGDDSGKEPACNAGDIMRGRFDPWVRKSPRRRAWQLAPVF